MSFVVWMFAISALIQVQPASSVQAYRAFAAAMPGDAANGKAIFQRKNIACANCHTIGEGSLRAGPDLLGIGDKYPRAELIRAVLEPSAFILTGYAATTFVTESGTVHLDLSNSARGFDVRVKKQVSLFDRVAKRFFSNRQPSQGATDRCNR